MKQCFDYASTQSRFHPILDKQATYQTKLNHILLIFFHATDFPFLSDHHLRLKYLFLAQRASQFFIDLV